MTVASEPLSCTDPLDPLDPLRLRNCPQCEYLLEGLPEEGICPECGFAYDRSVVIVRCQGPGAYRLNSYALVSLAAVLGGVFLFIILMKPQTLKYATQMVLMLGSFSAVLGVVWLDRVTSPRAGDWLLWITALGIGVQTDLDPDSVLAKLRRWLAIVWLPLYAMAGFLPIMLGPLWYVGLPIASVMGIGLLWLQLGIQVKPAVPAAGPRPALFSWSSVSRIELAEFKSGRYRIRVLNDSWVAKNRRLVDATLCGPPQLVDQLRQRIAQFGGKVAG
jgi:hypothetical protein